MKDRPFVYAKHQYASSSEPRYVVSIEFTPASFEYFASHTGIADIPAGVIENCVESFSSVSQSFDPETGASRIGSLSVQLGDIGGAITDAFQARLVAGNGVRDKQLRFYKGFEGMSFNDFELKWTQDVHEVTEDHARYKISCSDIQRSMRTEIFELKQTILDATLSASATTATVADTNDFILVEHGTSYSHGPSATWGYIKIDDEVIGYTGKTAGTFTGLERGLFNTLQAEHVVDPADPPERRPEVEEYVYLELPIPKLVKALLTGVLHGQGGATLPAHWHMGIDINLIEDSQFTDIGVDLWDPANDAVGLPGHFTDIDSIDGKQFIEKECFLLAQIFSPVLADGKLGLRRFTPALATAAHLVTLNESNVQKHTSLKHSMRAVFNRIVLNWSWIAGEFRRQTIKLDTDSIAKHGEAPIKIYNFRGLASNIATLSVLTQRFDAIRDRFSAPPLSINVDVSKSLDRMELGDICLVQLPNVRDMAAETVNAIDRAFEIRQIREDRKRLTFVLSGSSAEAVPVAPSVNALPDGFYDSTGTELSTVVPITGGVTDAGTTTLVGDPLLANSVFYFLGNLTIAATTTLNLDDNVQLRVRGFLTVNGVLNGDARGLAGVVDSIDISTNPRGLKGFFGATVGGDGAESDPEFNAFFSRPPAIQIGDFGTVPHLNLDVVGNALNGLPTDLRGTSGGPGGKLVTSIGNQVQGGGTGGPGGSGLMIICRGISFGGGASIDLAGGDGLSGTQDTLLGHQFFPGGGGGGAPGAMYILLDGDRLVPDLSTVFSAIGGDTPIDGTPMYAFYAYKDLLGSPSTGFKDDTRRLSNVNWTAGAFRTQFIPVPETPVEDLPDTDLTVHYILATNGNAIHNGVGTLTLEAHRLLAGSDELLSTGTIKLFDPGDNEVTVANGYVTGSDGYTGILDSGDITGDIVITLKDGATGVPLDTITLVDVADGAAGAPGSDGADAVYGVVEPENGLAWTRAPNAGAWTPSQATTDLDCTFFQAGVEVARIARRITLNTGDGTLTAAAIAHKGGDLNTSRVNITLIGNGSTAETVQFDYSFGGEDASVAETVNTSQGGDDGATGAAGDDGADAIHGSIEPENGLTWTRAANGGAWSPAQVTTDLDCIFEQAGVAVARIARRITLNTVDGTLSVSTVTHKGGDLNLARVTVTAINPGSTAVTVQFDYSFGGETASVAITVNSSVSGNDGAPGFSTSYVYDDLDTTGLAAGPSRYAILTDRTNEATGDQNDFSLADGLLLNKADLASAHDLEIYYQSVIVGDRVTYWISANRWYLYEIESVEASGGSGSTLRFRWGVKLIEFAEDSNANISTSAGTPVQFQFNRAEIGNFKDVKFKRSATVPATPTGDNPTGWTDIIPAGVDAIYEIIGTKTFNGVLIGNWSTPIRIQGLVNRGAYATGTAYLPDDVVQFAERSYICTTATTGNDPSGTNAGNTWWDLLAGKGDPGDPPTPFVETIVVPTGGPANLRSLANAHSPPYQGIEDATITFTVAPAAVITGNADGGHGLDTGTWPTNVTIALTLENDGIIRGGAGKGGAGGAGPGAGSPGLNAGDAIFAQEDLTVDNAPLGPGLIQAAGGGGGGGGGFTSGGAEPFDHGGGGGGGAFPNGNGGAGGTGDNPSMDGDDGLPGTTGGGGAGGAGSSSAGTGGAGGNVNANGVSGQGVGGHGAGGAGGTRGFAVRKNGHTVTVTGGTVTGQQG